MIRDATRYLPCMIKAKWETSLYEVKSVLLRNERDDGRPILFEKSPDSHGIYSVLGGKLDNIYDLFDTIKAEGGVFSNAHYAYLKTD